MTAACVFCGGTPTTKEHVLPKWIREVLPGGPGKILHEWRGPGDEEPGRQWHANAVDFQANTVCDPCNSGWMEELETVARPFLTSMIQGRGRTLYGEGRQIVAFWAQKTALMLDLAQPQWNRSMFPRDYSALYETKAPLPNTSIWLGANDFGRDAHAHTHGVELRDSKTDVLTRGYGATIQVGYLVLEIMRIEREDGAIPQVGGQLAPILRRLWPREVPVTWPQQVIINLQLTIWLAQAMEHVPVWFTLPG